jgi:hypothetical protein
VISRPEQITPEWLTDVFRKKSLLDAAKVTSVRIVLTKTLPVSMVARLEVDYSPGASDIAPSKLFLKLSNPTYAQPGLPDAGPNEVRFYQLVGDDINGPPLVKCYDTGYSSDLSSSYILMEDLSDTHFQPKSPGAPSEICSGFAVKCLAQFHALWWDHPRLGHDIGNVFDQVWLKDFTVGLEDSVRSFTDFLGESLSMERRRIYERMLALSNTVWGRLTDPAGLTITHGDTHWWNFLYPRDPISERTRIFDWQLWHLDLGPRDLAFLIALGGFAERRPELDMQLVRLYHDTLLDHGVRNYSWSRFWDDYRYSAIRNLNIPVIFWTQGKHPDTWGNALERAFQAYDELNCNELLEN